MAFNTPQAKLTVQHPAAQGFITGFGLSRDWRPNDRWQLRNSEYIEPLGAIAPCGDLRPVDMTAATWTLQAGYNQAARFATVAGNPPASWLECYDGSAYPAGTPDTTYGVYLASVANDLQPNWVLQVVREAPPPAQAVTCQVSVGMACSLKVSQDQGTGQYFLDSEGSWLAGKLSLALPYASDNYRNPLLHAIAPAPAGGYDLFTTGMILSEGPTARAMRQGVTRETWVFEYVEDPNLFSGGHILIRSTVNPGSWWHYYHDCVRVTAGQMTLFVGGARHALNLSPIYYSNSSATNVAHAWAADYKLLPADEWNAAVSWGTLSSPASNWTVSASGAPGPGLRPLVEMNPATGETPQRPVLWLATESHPAVITTPTGLPEAESTDGDGRLRSLTYTLNREWKGAGGTAEFYCRGADTPYPDWREYGLVTINMGWETGGGAGLEPTDVASGFIMPGGLARFRDGELYLGQPHLRLTLGDFVVARMRQTCIIDLRQAGGRTIGDWFREVGNRLGLQPEQINVDAAVEALAIPAHDTPSIPNLAPQDGDSWEKHCDAVCNALGLRWGWDDSLFIDAGRPHYSPGAEVSFTIDYDTLTEADEIYQVIHTHDGRRYRNCYKGRYGPENARRETYAIAAPGDRQESGGDYWVAIDELDGKSLSAIDARWQRDYGSARDEIYWRGPLRVGLVPDMFVKIGDCPGLGLVSEAVYQITYHAMSIDSDANQATSAIRAELVYTP